MYSVGNSDIVSGYCLPNTPFQSPLNLYIMKTNLLSFLVFTVFSFQSAYAVKYFVTPDGSEDSDGLSWETSTSLNAILTSTKLSEGDEIFVKKGTYVAPEGASFTCNRADVKVYGNCEGTESENLFLISWTILRLFERQWSPGIVF